VTPERFARIAAIRAQVSGSCEKCDSLAWSPARPKMCPECKAKAIREACRIAYWKQMQLPPEQRTWKRWAKLSGMSTQAGSTKAAQSPEMRATVGRIVHYGGASGSGMRNMIVNSALVIEAPEGGEGDPTLYVIPPTGVPEVKRNVPYSATLTANCWTWPPTIKAG
jgi:hypothetical protein